MGPGIACSISENGLDAFLMDLEEKELQTLDGTGLTIAFLDTGINDHVVFQGRIKQAMSFVDGSPPGDSEGHGTACAGIAAGCKQENDNFRRGVAPGIQIVSCKVANDQKSYSKPAIIKGLQFLRDKKTEEKNYVDVLSLSFQLENPHKIKELIEQLNKMGVIIVCAAGNQGYVSEIGFPANMIGNVLCIGSHNKKGKVSDSAPRGQELTFLAPGENIWTPSIKDTSSFEVHQGSSLAAPIVGGLICLILQKIKKECSSQFEKAHDMEIMKKILQEISSNIRNFKQEEGYGSLHPKYLSKINLEKFIKNLKL